MARRDYDYLFKIILVENRFQPFNKNIIIRSGVGKSSILLRYADNIFNDKYIPSLGVDFRFKNIVTDNIKVKMQIWDLLVDERLMGIRSSFVKDPHGIIIVYDITSKESFDNIKYLIEDIRRYIDPKTPIMIVGNKLDLSDIRQVSEDELKVLATEYNVIYIECSAKMNINIDKIFEEISRKIISLRNSSVIKLDRNISDRNISNRNRNICWS